MRLRHLDRRSILTVTACLCYAAVLTILLCRYLCSQHLAEPCQLTRDMHQTRPPRHHSGINTQRQLHQPGIARSQRRNCKPIHHNQPCNQTCALLSAASVSTKPEKPQASDSGARRRWRKERTDQVRSKAHQERPFLNHSSRRCQKTPKFTQENTMASSSCQICHPRMW